MSNSYIISVDIETLGTKPGSAILSIGACCGDIYKIVSAEDITTKLTYFSENISLRDSLDRGFTISMDTLDWWLGQDPKIFSQIRENNKPLAEVISNFTYWIYNTCQIHTPKGEQPPTIWAYGASFDFGIIDAACAKIKVKSPWEDTPGFRYLRDARTLLALENLKLQRVNTHVAWEDAMNQIEAVARCLVSHERRKDVVQGGF